MYLQQIHLKNIACFDDLTLDFTQPSTGEPCRWIVLLGENGTGKSTVLKMLALSLLGRDMVREVTRGVEWGSFSRSRNDQEVTGTIETILTVSGTGKERKHKNESNQYHTVFKVGPTKSRLVQPRDYDDDYDDLWKTLYDPDNLTNGWFSCGYGPWRTLSRSTYSGQRPTATELKAYRFATMFNAEYALMDVTDWLLGLHHQKLLADSANESAGQVFSLATDALRKVLLGTEYKKVDQNREIVFNDNGVEVAIDQLSDGYRSVTAWIGDLVRRLVQAFPNDPLNAQGIVLVDEIDIHLHPAWQRKIVEDVRAMFPNLQFIVSSHSPFIAQDMRPEDKIIVFKREGEGVVSREDTGFVKGWRVDQILTSYLFDLETTRDISITVKEQEYQLLLDLQSTQGLTVEQKGRLNELKEWLSKNRSAPGETLDENEVYDATQTLIDLLDEYLK